jgi:hypothetical protein
VLASKITDELYSLELPQALIDLLIENSFDKERISRMNIDDLAVILSIDIESAKIIINSVSNYSNMMFHNMRELR